MDHPNEKSLIDLLADGETDATIGGDPPERLSKAPHIRGTFGQDCWPYGLEANRRTLEALVTYLEEQSMVDKQIPIEELFTPVRPANFRIR